MKIEVACKKSDSTKVKGDLLEGISKELLEAQGYSVIEELRITGAELDLMCKHQVSGKEIYVECKAQKEKIGAPILRQLNGTVDAYEYSEGWLLSTSEFGKEAKGFIDMWQKKPLPKSSKLSFYTPEKIIKSLQKASILCPPPIEEAKEYVGGDEFIGEWLLLLTSYGRYWAVYTLQGGAPCGVLIYNAKSGRHIQDEETLTNISRLETVLADYNLHFGVCEEGGSPRSMITALPNVVEVQTGDSWDDYRPARPKDFVGRESTQKQILDLLKSTKEKTSDTRVFAITGKSGLGKSSLIAKVRDRARNKFHKNRYFIYAVDMRGAKTPSYISASLLACLKEAQKKGFGEVIDIQLEDPSAPLSSPSIVEYLRTVEEKRQVICLVFDQFEELYSKTELFGVFSAASDLMLDVVSYKGNITLGFAWKTDSTTQQDHPAYHMWHNLSDYRREYKLDVFNKGEIIKSITAFEKEIKKKIPIELRLQIEQSCQGFPWLLKKLCINMFENLKQGGEVSPLLADLDVGGLFQDDLRSLSQAEHTCLKMIAKNAPADWSETIESSGISVLNSLVHKRLVIKSGDRLNVYWDIFKDYLLTGNAPVVPFNYIPTTDVSSMIKVAKNLNNSTYLSAANVSKKCEIKERTVWNVGADLVMFGIAERNGTSFKLHRKITDVTDIALIQKIRDKLGKHSLKLALYKDNSGKIVDKDTIADTLKSSLPKARFSDKTWKIYTNRLITALVYSGYLIRTGTDLVVQDKGAPLADAGRAQRQGRAKGLVFSATASPASTCETLLLIEENDDIEEIVANGYNNSLTVLSRFDLISIEGSKIKINSQSIMKYGGNKEAVWTSAKNEPAISRCIEKLNQEPNITGPELGDFVSSEYDKQWTSASKSRNGNSLKQWSNWIREGMLESSIPPPPGRTK
jgi:hypothetical protein